MTCNVQPIEFNCVVEMRPVLAKIRGFHKTDEIREREAYMNVYATLVAVGPRAFDGFGEPAPKVGDRVMIKQYGGQFLDAFQLKTMRIIPDKEIVAIGWLDAEQYEEAAAKDAA